MLKMQFFKADVDNNCKQVLLKTQSRRQQIKINKEKCWFAEYWNVTQNIKLWIKYTKVWKLEVMCDIAILNHEDVKLFWIYFHNGLLTIHKHLIFLIKRN